MNGRQKGSLLLLIGAMIWGLAFIAQSAAAETIGPWTFNAARYILAAAFLALCLPFMDKARHIDVKAIDHKELWKAGVLCGSALCAASYFQQAGIAYTSAAKAGFITALYVVLVPVFGLVIHKHAGWNIWLACLLAALALYLISGAKIVSLQSGDFMELICAGCFAVQILLIDHYAGKVEAMRLTCVQFFTAAILSAVMMLVSEHNTLTEVLNAWLPIAYAGILSGGVGYTLQTFGQKSAEPAVASVLMSLESVFAALFGFLILHQVLTIKELAGCIVMFAAVLIAELTGNQ